MATDRRSLLDRLVGTCLSLLVGAAAVYIAVQLVEAVWVVLLVIALVAAVAVVGVAVLRGRSRGW